MEANRWSEKHAQIQASVAGRNDFAGSGPGPARTCGIGCHCAGLADRTSRAGSARTAWQAGQASAPAGRCARACPKARRSATCSSPSACSSACSPAGTQAGRANTGSSSANASQAGRCARTRARSAATISLARRKARAATRRATRSAGWCRVAASGRHFRHYTATATAIGKTSVAARRTAGSSRRSRAAPGWQFRCGPRAGASRTAGKACVAPRCPASCSGRSCPASPGWLAWCCSPANARRSGGKAGATSGYAASPGCWPLAGFAAADSGAGTPACRRLAAGPAASP